MDVIYRRKRGLSVPVANMINRGLRSEVDRLLDRDQLRNAGLVNVDYVRGLLDAHRSGRANHARALWAVIVLHYWYERWAAAVSFRA